MAWGRTTPTSNPLPFDAWRRADVRVLVADAGYDSEKGRAIGRLDMGVRTVIPPLIGRPAGREGADPPGSGG